MKPGEIRVDRASRRFRVDPEPSAHAQGAGAPPPSRRAGEVWALRDVSLAVEPGDAVGLVGRNGSGKTTLLSLIAGIITPTSGRVEAGGRVASLLELGAGFHPDFTGRENVYLNASLYGLKRKTIDERFDEIVAFAELERVHRPPGADVLVGDVHAARLRRRRAHRRRRAPARRGVRGRRRGVPAQVLRQDLRVQAAGRDDRLRLPRRRLGRAALRARGAAARTGGSSSTARRRRRSPATTRCSRRSATPRSARPACASTEAARRGSPRRACSAPDGEERQQFAAGEPLTSSSCASTSASRSCRRRISLELRDEAGLLLAAASQDTDELGWDAAPGERVLRFEVERPPLADGRFRLRFELGDRSGGRSTTGSTTRSGSWSIPGRGRARAGAPRRHLVAAGDRRRCRSNRTMSYQTCPDWPELMEIAPDLQFKHLTVRDAQLPAEALMKIPDVNLDEVEICADVDRHVFFERHTDPRVVDALRGLALVRPHGVDDVRPRPRVPPRRAPAGHRGDAVPPPTCRPPPRRSRRGAPHLRLGGDVVAVAWATSSQS